jgi:hypothetical protein
MTANQYWAKFNPEKSARSIKLLSLIRSLNRSQDRLCDKMDVIVAQDLISDKKAQFKVVYDRYYQLVDIEYNCRAQRKAIHRHEDQYCNKLVGISA